jgi:hypothetical protein
MQYLCITYEAVAVGFRLPGWLLQLALRVLIVGGEFFCHANDVAGHVEVEQMRLVR